MSGGGGDTDVSFPDDRLVEFYQIDLNPPAEAIQAYRQILSPSEQARADRYVTSNLTRRSIVCRGALRRILGAVLGVPPAEVKFRLGPHGKPSLDTDDPSLLREFNVSHTGDLAVIAIASQRTVGVDVERLDRHVRHDELAARFFSPAECRDYFALQESQRLTAFYRIWTCKEAYLKATGAGLSFPLNRFRVSVAPDEPPGLLDVEQAPSEIGRWSFVLPPVGADYAAALAVEGHGWTLVCRQWNHRVGCGISCDRK
jgi:4'-phosphopantetheinyl transferase